MFANFDKLSLVSFNQKKKKILTKDISPIQILPNFDFFKRNQNTGAKI